MCDDACPFDCGICTRFAACRHTPFTILEPLSMPSIYDQHLDRNPANFTALSPVSFVERSAEIFADLPAVVHGARRYNWAQVRERSARLAAALRALGWAVAVLSA